MLVYEVLNAAGSSRWTEPFAGIFAAYCSSVLNEAMDGEGSLRVIGEELQD